MFVGGYFSSVLEVMFDSWNIEGGGHKPPFERIVGYKWEKLGTLNKLII